MKKIGIIGAGRWGKNLIRVFNGIAEVKMVAHKGNPKTKKFLESNYPKISVTTNPDDVIEDEELDAVVIATPIETHFELLKKCIERDKAVFVEKPMVASVEQAEKLKLLLQKGKSRVFVGHLFVHHPVFMQLQKIHDKDPIVKIHSYWNRWGPFDSDIIWNLLCHDLSIISALAKTDFKMESKSESFTEMTDYVSVTIKSDIEASLEVNIAMPVKEKIMQVKTSSGNLYVWKDDKLYTRKGNQLILKYSSQEPLTFECKNFVNFLKGEDTITDFEFGKKIVEMCEEVHELIRT